MSHKKKLYRRKVLKQLYFADTLSCAEISAAIKKSLPVTTRLINELIEEGVVLETGHAPSTGGRRPATYSIRPDVLYIVSVALDQFVARIVIMDMQNHFVTAVKKIDLPLSNQLNELEILTREIVAVIADAGIAKSKIMGVGIGMPGFVDVEKGMNYSFLKAGSKSIVSYIRDEIDIPVCIDNDSSLIALAELRFGEARRKKNAMVVNIGWGIGLGMILEGQLFRGQNGFAGELSHIPLFSNGKLCSCGKSGCLETEASLLLVIERAKEGLKNGRASRLKLSAMDRYEEASEAIVDAVREGDRFAIELLSQTAYNIGRGVAVLIHLLNPETIILSGRGSSAGKVWQAPIQQAVNEHCIPRLALNTTVEMSTLGYDAELIGAAALVMENYEKEFMSEDSSEMEEDLLLN